MYKHDLLQINELRTYFYSEAKQAFIRSVDGVSLSVEKGRTLGIVGESGSGKSVLMLSAMGLISSNPGIISGRVTLNTNGENSKELLDGIERYVSLRYKDKRIISLQKDNKAWNKVQETNMSAIRGKYISMIFQNPKSAMNPFETVGDQISEMIRLHTDLKDENAIRDQSIEWLEKVKIDSPSLRYNNYPHGLSGGMCQRAMIAMALSSKPSLLIADEPTTGLDATIQSKIVELLLELKSELGTTTVLISHDINVIKKMADTIAVMYGGKVLENGAVDQILSHQDSPGHPYTKALLASIPDAGNLDAQGRLPAIPGEVLDTINVSRGCRFYERCTRVTPIIKDKCQNLEPPLFNLDETHAIRCWLFESGG